MHGYLPRFFTISALTLLLAACGGSGSGGGGVTPGTGDGGTTGTPTLTLTAVDSAGATTNSVTGTTPITLRATLANGSGDAVSGAVVAFTSAVGQLTPASGNALTNSAGVAVISLGAGTEANAGQASASATVDGVAVTSNGIGIESDGLGSGGGSATVLVAMTLTTPDSSINVSRSNPGTGTVTVTDASGAAISQAVVQFTTTNGELTPLSGAVATNASGVATVAVLAGQSPGAAILNASVSVGAENVDADPINYISDGDGAPSLTLSIPSGTFTTSVSNAVPVTITATVVNALGAPVQGIIVNFSSAGNGVLSRSQDITNVSGQATTTLLPGTIAGLGTITASAAVGATSLEAPDVVSFNSAGDGPFVGVGTSNLSLAIALVDGSGNPIVGSIQANNPGILQATVTDATGNPVANSRVEFVTSLGDMFPSNGLALTNASGVATVALNAGNTPGAGVATANVLVGSGKFNPTSLTFETLGNAGDTLIALTLTFTDKTPGNGTNIITKQDSATVGILVEDDSQINLPNRTATITTSLGTVKVGNGTAAQTITAISDSDGRISVLLEADDNFGTGDLVVTVGDTTASVQFEVGVAGLQIGTCSGGTSATDCSAPATFSGFAAPLGTAPNGVLSVSTSPLSAGGTSAVSVVVLDSTGAPVDDIDISFASNCTGLTDALTNEPLASISQTVSSLANGVATATYQDNGCARTDIITATEASTGATATGNIEVLPAQIGAIIFDSVTDPNGIAAPNIFIRESGGNSTAFVTFQVLDVRGDPAADQNVQFTLTSKVGGIQLENADATTGIATGLTDAEGKTTAIVSAGFIATTVRVRASLDVDIDDDGDITDFSDVPPGAKTLVTLSDQLSINTGIADQNSFTLTAVELNFEGLDYEGETVTLTTFLSDHFNNPVSNTSVQFHTEFGTITAACTTGNGICNATLTSTDPRGPLDPNITTQTLAATGCPATFINDEAMTIAGTNGDTLYQVSSVLRVETTAHTRLTLNTDYTVDTDGSGITCVGGSVSCVDTANLRISYTRAFLDEDNDGLTAHVISNPGQGTAPFRSSPQGAVPCLTGTATDQGGTVSSGYFGGLGQVYGGRSTILAFAQGEESFIDTNGDGIYSFGEPFVDLTEAFDDFNEDKVFGNGTVGSDSSRDVTSRGCYGPNSPITNPAESLGNCYQVGGDEEGFVDFNSNGKFDGGNGIYNGTLCPKDISDRTDTCDNNADPCDEATEQYCTRELVSIRKDMTILFSGSAANFSLRDASTGEFINQIDLQNVASGTFITFTGPVTRNDGVVVPAATTIPYTASQFTVGYGNTDVAPGVGDTNVLISGSGGVFVHYADINNGRMPSGTNILVTAGTDGCEIQNTPSNSLLSTNDFAPVGIFISLDNPPAPANGSAPITVRVTTPNTAFTEFAFTCSY